MDIKAGVCLFAECSIGIPRESIAEYSLLTSVVLTLHFLLRHLIGDAATCRALERQDSPKYLPCGVGWGGVVWGEVEWEFISLDRI